MSKPSTDTATERAVAAWREDGSLPKHLSLRFLALLQKKELARLDRYYAGQVNQPSLEPLLPNVRRFYLARHLRIQSERRQRGHIK